MSWATGLMVYLVIWWTVLFAVLPLGGAVEVDAIVAVKA